PSPAYESGKTIPMPFKKNPAGGSFVLKPASCISCIFYILPALPTPVLAASTTTPDSGDTAWMLMATALVLFMTLPGLALFYAGMVRAKNVLSVLMQCLAIACLASLIWFAYGYSLVFTGSSFGAVI